jgi:hypothetical protein
MTRLAPLKARLHSLRLARSAIRWGCALSSGTLVVLAGWTLTYWLDRGLLLSWAGRAVMLLGWLAGVGWLFARQVLPAWRQTESLEDVALIVEREQRIDSDLIAALQFDALPAGAWGSPRLSTAVVDYVAEFSPSLNVFEGFSWQPLPRRLTTAATALLIASATCAVYPSHAAAFWNRFWLGSAHYPTRTVLAKLTINGEEISVFHAAPVRLRVAQGESLQLVVAATGELPADGAVEVRGLQTGQRALWKLTTASTATYQLEPQSLTENVRLRVRLGDAVSDPVDIALLPLPVFELRWTVVPPGYAPSADDIVPEGTRQFAVLAGSRLLLELACLNKPLNSVQLVLPQGQVALQPERRGKETVWTVPTGTAFDSVTEPLTYELAVVDGDGLSPQPRVFGQIRLRPDRTPRVAATGVTKHVLPTAKPKIRYGAVDDFGVTRVVLLVEIRAAEGEPRRDERTVWQRPANGPGETTVRGEATLDLSPYQLNKGDQVQVTVAADDERGTALSQRGTSEPLLFDVTDRNGILSGLLETDQQSAKQLDAIILRELGIGGGKP